MYAALGMNDGLDTALSCKNPTTAFRKGKLGYWSQEVKSKEGGFAIQETKAVQSAKRYLRG